MDFGDRADALEYRLALENLELATAAAAASGFPV